jgi:hypothetical protein
MNDTSPNRVEAVVSRCKHRHCVHDRRCTHRQNYWQHCPQRKTGKPVGCVYYQSSTNAGGEA